jgi:sugar/nucleoside kinase (ribokinase family)
MTQADLPPVVVAGNIVLDMFPPLILEEGRQFQDALIGGQTVEVGPLTVSTGGCVSNTGIALHMLGVPVKLMGAIADDILGREIERIFERVGIDTSRIARIEGNSSYTIVLAPPSTDRIFLHCPGSGGLFNTEDVDWGTVKRAGIFHLGYPPYLPALFADDGEALAEMFRKAKVLGATTSLDMAFPLRTAEASRKNWHTILHKTLPYVDLLLPGVEEMLFLLERSLFEDLCTKAAGQEVLTVIEPAHVMELAELLLQMGTGVVALKAGYKGLYVRTAGSDRLSELGRAKPNNMGNWSCRELWEPGFKPRQIASATGAGDVAVAGFLAAFLRAHTIEMTLGYACALGTKNLEAMDATSSICSWDEITDLIEAGWEKTLLDNQHPGWIFDNESGLWVGPHDKCG